MSQHHSQIIPSADGRLPSAGEALSAEELLSALADGELAGGAATQALDAWRAQGASAGSWATYHLIGDVLRSPGAPVRAADAGFVGRFSARLALETSPAPTVLPSISAPSEAAPLVVAVNRLHLQPAANDHVFRWKLAAGFASLAAVSAVAWSISGTLFAPASGSQLAQAAGQAESQQILVASPQGPMVRDARLEELLAAHRQLGGGSALEAPSGFLRNAAFEPSQNAGR